MNKPVVAAAGHTIGDAPAATLARIEAQCTRLTTSSVSGSIVWRRWGSGPPLVLLHGGYGSWRHWIRTIPAFASSRTVLVPDLPGLGDSGDVPETITPEHIAAIITDGFERLIKTCTPIDLVGFSFGALIAGHVAARAGPALRSLTLVGAGALGTPHGEVQLAKARPGISTAELREIHRINLSRLMIADTAKIDQLAILIQYENTRRARMKSRRLALTDSLAQALHRGAPKRLHAIWGERDQSAGTYIPEREAVLRSLCPDLRSRLVPNAGHWVAYEAPESFNPILEEFLA